MMATDTYATPVLETPDIEQLITEASPQLGLLGVFPKELRDRIWYFVLRPDCTNGVAIHHKDCHKPHEHHEGYRDRIDILVLSSEIYNEASSLLRKAEQRIELGFCISPWQLAIDRLTELQFRVLRHVAVVIHLPTTEGPTMPKSSHKLDKISNRCLARKELKKLTKLTTKDNSLQSVRIFIQRQEDAAGRHRDWPKTQLKLYKFFGIPSLLLELITILNDRGVHVSLGRAYSWRDGLSHDSDVLIPFVLQTAYGRGIFVERMMDPDPQLSMEVRRLQPKRYLWDVLSDPLTIQDVPLWREGARLHLWHYWRRDCLRHRDHWSSQAAHRLLHL